MPNATFLSYCKVSFPSSTFTRRRFNFAFEMKNGERIIPFSKKDKRQIERQLRNQLSLNILYILAVLMLLVAFLLSYNHAWFKFLAGASIVSFTVMLVLCIFEKRPTLAIRLIRDLNVGKKRVVYGSLEHVHFRQQNTGQAEQIYEIGPYRFELGQLSPVLKKFKQVMPGQSVEIHQCLHSGIILELDVVEAKSTI